MKTSHRKIRELLVGGRRKARRIFASIHADKARDLHVRTYQRRIRARLSL
jgi:hypothetical protein